MRTIPQLLLNKCLLRGVCVQQKSRKSAITDIYRTGVELLLGGHLCAASGFIHFQLSDAAKTKYTQKPEANNKLFFLPIRLYLPQS